MKTLLREKVQNYSNRIIFIQKKREFKIDNLKIKNNPNLRF